MVSLNGLRVSILFYSRETNSYCIYFFFEFFQDGLLYVHITLLHLGLIFTSFGYLKHSKPIFRVMCHEVCMWDRGYKERFQGRNDT